MCNADGAIFYDGPIDLGLCIRIYEFGVRDVNVRSLGWVGNTGDGKVNVMLRPTSTMRSEERGCLKNEDLRDVHKCQLSDNSGGRSGGRTTAETTNLMHRGKACRKEGAS